MYTNSGVISLMFFFVTPTGKYLDYNIDISLTATVKPLFVLYRLDPTFLLHILSDKKFNHTCNNVNYIFFRAKLDYQIRSYIWQYKRDFDLNQRHQSYAEISNN